MPVKGQLDFSHLCKIHQVLFEDAYQFAGKLREENIAKDYFVFALLLILLLTQMNCFEI